MSKHTSYRGRTIDMEALRNENAHSPAMGNMRTNARGDLLGPGGTIAKTVDQIARENQRVRTAIQATSLKDDIEDFEEVKDETPVVKKSKKVEKEQPNRDIVQDDE